VIIRLGVSLDQSQQINHLAAGRGFGEGQATGGPIRNSYTLEFDRPKQVRAYYKPFRELTNGRCLATAAAAA